MFQTKLSSRSLDDRSIESILFQSDFPNTGKLTSRRLLLLVRERMRERETGGSRKVEREIQRERGQIFYRFEGEQIQV